MRWVTWSIVTLATLGALAVALYLYPPSRALVRSFFITDFVPSAVRITFPEGFTTREMALEVNKTFPTLSTTTFRLAASPYEGYLFPDTYIFSALVSTTTIITTLRENFNAKIAPLKDDVARSGHSLEEIVIMASLLEKEARTDESRRIVAGILWNRLKLGMPLQVDAVFGYIFGRDTYSPSAQDLKTESPYNLYLHTGLPPGPINNPGLHTLNAALHPATTTYLYYLTGSDNLMHYATTHAGHQANRAKYLK